VIGSIIGFLGLAMGNTMSMTPTTGDSMAATALVSRLFAGGASVASLIVVVIGFFITTGIQYLLAKAFGGNGEFKQQAYSYLLFNVPLTVASNILGLIPIFGTFVGFAGIIYTIILNVFSIMSSHRLSGGKATAVVLIPLAVIFLVVLLCVFAVVALLMSAAIHTR